MLTKLGTYLVLRRVWNPIDFQGHLKDVDSRVFTRMLHGKNLTPWPLILKINRVPDSPKDYMYVCTKFARSQGVIFRRGDTPRFALPLLILNLLEVSVMNFFPKINGLTNKFHWRMLILECSQGCYTVKIWPGDIDLWPMTLKINRVPDSPKD
jgi:hypothetical protein